VVQNILCRNFVVDVFYFRVFCGVSREKKVDFNRDLAWPPDFEAFQESSVVAVGFWCDDVGV